jgi:hypothetical protein
VVPVEIFLNKYFGGSFWRIGQNECMYIMKFNIILDLLISVLDCASLFVESLGIKADKILVGPGI